MSTNNEDLLSNLNDFKLKQTEALGELRGDMKLATAAIEQMNETLKSFKSDMVSKAEVAKENEKIWAEITSLKDWNTWAIRLVVGAVILAVVGLVIRTKTL